VSINNHWGHLVLRLPRLRLHRAGGVRCRVYLHLAPSSQRPDRGYRTRGVRLRLLGRDDHRHVGAKPTQKRFMLVDYYLTDLAFQASGAEPLA
jgi:hypothetical protein